MNRLNFRGLKEAVRTRDFEDMCVTYLGPDGPQTPKLPAKNTANDKIRWFDIGTEFKIFKNDNGRRNDVIVFKIGKNEYEMNQAEFGQGAGLNQTIFSDPPQDYYCEKKERGGKKKRSKKLSLKKKQKKSARKSKRFYFF
jgi:hypothetical protein